MKSLRSFERTTARQVKAMEGCPPPILPINYHNTALELSSKQVGVLLIYLDTSRKGENQWLVMIIELHYWVWRV